MLESDYILLSLSLSRIIVTTLTPFEEVVSWRAMTDSLPLLSGWFVAILGLSANNVWSRIKVVYYT